MFIFYFYFFSNHYIKGTELELDVLGTNSTAILKILHLFRNSCQYTHSLFIKFVFIVMIISYAGINGKYLVFGAFQNFGWNFMNLYIPVFWVFTLLLFAVPLIGRQISLWAFLASHLNVSSIFRMENIPILYLWEIFLAGCTVCQHSVMS